MNDLVLIPGLGSDGAVWQSTSAAMGRDLRCSVGDTLQDDTLAGMAHRILAAAPGRFVLAGLSMGGMVALEMMRIAPGRIAGLALIDTNAFPDTAQQAEARAQTVRAVRAGVDMKAAGERSLAWLVHPRTAAETKQVIVDMGVRLGAEVYARQVEAVLNRPDQRALLPRIAVPTVVIHGEEDAMIPLARAREQAALIPGAALEIVPDCGHLPPIEKPAVVATILEGLCRQAT